MKKFRNNSDHASTLQVVLSTGMIFTSAILLAITAPPNRENAPRQDLSKSQLEENSDSITALGSYPDTSILLSTDTTVTPDAAPTNTTSINVSTSTNFKGTLAGDPATGVVRVTDAHPAGTYKVTVRAFNGSGPTATTAFTLTVTTPVTCIPVSFATTNYSGGALPFSVALGDFNNDGKQDLAVGNYGLGMPHPQQGSVFIFLGNGTGNFTATEFSIGLFQVREVAVGDFNGDGRQDLAVVIDNNVAIWLGDGAGNFGVATTFPAGTLPVSVTVGDFNDDGKQDLAVTNNGSKVLIFLGDGTGNFSPPTTFDDGGTFGQIVVGDFNEDGKQDLAVTNSSTANVSILLGNGTGGFSAPTIFGTGPHPVAVALGDFNGDGKQDLATTNRDPDNVSILLGDGAGNFSAATHFSADTTPGSIAVGDFNGDGKQDLAVDSAVGAGAKVSILLGDGAGNFGVPIRLGVGPGNAASSVTVGDFNGDGKQDLATGYPSVTIWLRDCASTPTPTATATATATPPPTPTPCPLFTITGTVGQCTTAGPSGIALSGVTITRTISGGGGGGSTTTDENGHYFLDGFSCVTNTFTPSKVARLPGSPGIDTTDVIAVQRHFLGISLLTGCRLAAADCASPVGISTTDVIAIQRFFVGRTTGLGNVGSYSFTPASRSYSPPVSNQTAQNYDALVFGDVASPIAAP